MLIFGAVVEQYADFASYADDSPCFQDWARRVADDLEVVTWLASLPVGKQQPNLVFAAARWHGVPAPGSYDGLRTALLADPPDGGSGSIRETILTRATQTNEVGRLATLVPAFSLLSGVSRARSGGRALALLEVGASAGLCLYPDRWSYAWSTPDGVVRSGPVTDLPVLACALTGDAPLPAVPPAVAWRGGIDLNPLDVTDHRADGDMAWLRMLVWPEHDDRRALLDAAVEVARADPPNLVRGDLLLELPGLVERAARESGAPVVVFHSAVIAYLTETDRELFHTMMASLVADGACRWVSNEGPRVLPRVTATGPASGPGPGRFVLGIDGEVVAWTHGHGRSLAWLA